MYPGSTNPNLDGKPVLILAIKGTDKTGTTTAYKFVNLEALIDTYKIITKSSPATAQKSLQLTAKPTRLKLKSRLNRITQSELRTMDFMLILPGKLTKFRMRQRAMFQF